MAKKNLDVRDPIAPLEEVGDPIGTASASGGAEFRVIGHGCFLADGKQLALGTVFCPSDSGMSEAQVMEMVRSRDIEPAVKGVTKPFSQEVVTKGAVSRGGSSNC